MVNKILMGFFNLVISLVNILLSPLETALNALIPGLSPALSKVSTFCNTMASYITWGISYTGLTVETLSIICSLLTASVMIPLTAHAIKLGLKWYNALKP